MIEIPLEDLTGAWNDSLLTPPPNMILDVRKLAEAPSGTLIVSAMIPPGSATEHVQEILDALKGNKTSDANGSFRGSPVGSVLTVQRQQMVGGDENGAFEIRGEALVVRKK